jgi:hypothetical protein
VLLFSKNVTHGRESENQQGFSKKTVDSGLMRSAGKLRLFDELGPDSHFYIQHFKRKTFSPR